MADENTLLAVDSLVANEFEVEIEGERMLGVFRVQGLTTFKMDESGSRVREAFQIIKMVQRDGNNPFNKWLRETHAATGSERPRRNLAIVAIDDGVETRRWAIEGAWISAVSYSSFDTASTEMVEEIVSIQYHSINEMWPATPNLE